MNSLEIISFKKNIKDYADKSGFPKEVVRLVFKELLEEASSEALNEALAELNKAEKEAKKDE